MKLEKLENQLKERLRQQEVSPADNSWEKLNFRLNEVQKANNPRPFAKVYWIAASLLLLMGLRLFLPVNGNDLSDELKISKSPAKELALPETLNSSAVTEVQTKEVSKGLDFKEVSKRTRQNLISATVLTPSMLQIRMNEPDQLSANTDSTKTDQGQDKNVVYDFMALKMSGSVEYSFSRQDLDADSLLQKAQQDLVNSPNLPTQNSIDPLALLEEVEGELDKSYREQLFEKLKVRINHVRTAMATRND